MPTHWYNIVADLPTPPPPPLHPGTKQPLTPDDLAPLFPMGLIAQEASTERWIEIPAEVHDIYRLWRPSPFYRALRLEQAIGTTARIYYKYEGASPVGSHKTNSAVPQAYFNKLEGRTRLTTETGAGQWGSALAFAAQIFGLQCDIWQVRSSYEGKPYRHVLMETFGAHVVASPSELTNAGRAAARAVPGHHRLARHGDLGGRGGRRDRPERRLLAGQRAEPRAAAPERDRPGGREAAGAVR
ncbi:MAG: pyridoxal-phosphate dependent enzyme [Propionicimonas sp.]